MRVLLVEDNESFSESLKLSLVEDGYAVDQAFDGFEGEDMALMVNYDLIVLDLMLPLKDGLQVCRELRNQHVSAPILMLTARDTVDDRADGLDCGADDYLVKPFALKELRARLRALLRRRSIHKTPVLRVGDLTLNPATHEVERSGQPIQLTPREFTLLEYFMRHPNYLVTREMAHEHIWGYDYTGSSNIVDVYVRRLRQKVDGPFRKLMFCTVRGEGYRLCGQNENG